MKSTLIRTLSLSAIVAGSLAFAIGCTQSGNVGTSHEVSHNESDKKGWFGGQYHEANTVYKNSDGSTSVETETTSTKGITTTIVRTKKTTFADGTVNSAKETRTIVKGSDNVVTESNTSK